MPKPFESLYETVDGSGEPLEWEWDEEEQVFRATGSDMAVYTLRPSHGDLTIDESAVEIEED